MIPTVDYKHQSDKAFGYLHIIAFKLKMKIWIKMSLRTPRKQKVIGGILTLIINAFISERLASRPGHFTRGENTLASHELEVEWVPELI